MIGLPLYRLLIAVGLVLASAMATARLGHAEPTTPCEARASLDVCAAPSRSR